MTNFRQIPADILEEIKVKNDIVEVVEQYVNLTKKTVNFLVCVLFIMKNTFI